SAGFIYFESEQPITASQYKQAIEHVSDMDPQAGVFHSDDMRIVQVRTSTYRTEQDYRSAIALAGITLKAQTKSAEELGINAAPANGTPVFTSTGDVNADRARYRAAVEQWNAAHPDAQLNITPVHER
ncbi:MAG TPA: hypothetical protein PK760_15765, partial [Flavobacteriales bacterium]|nr:hypothetical protein [Flavobacteriales bacterium]